MCYIQIIADYIADCIGYPYGDYIAVDAQNPPDIMCGCYRFVDGSFVLDDDKYAQFLKDSKPVPVPDYYLSELKTRMQVQNNDALAEFLDTHPLLYSDGKYYGVTKEDQSEISLNLMQYSLAVGVGYPAVLEWHAKGELCTVWTLEGLTELALLITQYVYPYIRKCQEYKVAIFTAENADELASIRFEYEEKTV